MLNPEHENRRAHLTEALRKSGLSQVGFARKAGVTPSYLSQILRKSYRFGEKAARALELKLRLPVGSFESRAGDQLVAVEVWDTPNDLPTGVFAIVPRIPVKLVTGGGASHQAEDLNLQPLAFRKEWLHTQNVTHRSNLRVCEVADDSMRPYLQMGDTALIDTGQSKVADNDIYALDYGGELRIRRLVKRFDGGITIRADDPRHPEEIVSQGDVDKLKIVGRMLWRGG